MNAGVRPAPPAAVADVLRGGGVAAYPTEAVWGLGCDPRDRAAVLRLLALKRREVEKGLILVAADPGQLSPFAALDALPADALRQVLATWPGPHTWIVPAAAGAPAWITGAHDGIAVRVSAHPVVAALCRAFGGALVSTSANPAGAPPPRQLAQFDADVLAGVDAIAEGEVGPLANPTPIRDARSGARLRD